MVTTRVGPLVTVPGHAVWACSEGVGGVIDCGGERVPTGEEGAPAGEGGRRSPEVGSQIFSPHQPTGHRRFCRALRVTSTAQLSTRRS